MWSHIRFLVSRIDTSTHKNITGTCTRTSTTTTYYILLYMKYIPCCAQKRSKYRPCRRMMIESTTVESGANDGNNPNVVTVAWPIQSDLVVDENNSCCIPVSTTIASCCYGMVLGWYLPENSKTRVCCNSIVVLGTVPINPHKFSESLVPLEYLDHEVQSLQSNLSNVVAINDKSETDQSDNNNLQMNSKFSDNDIRKVCFRDNCIQIVALAVRLTHDELNNTDSCFVRHKLVFDEYRKKLPYINIIFICPQTLRSNFNSTKYMDNSSDEIQYYPIWFDENTITEKIVSKRQIVFYKSTSSIRSDENAWLYQHGTSCALDNHFLFILTHAGVIWKEIRLYLKSMKTETSARRTLLVDTTPKNRITDSCSNTSGFLKNYVFLQQYSTFFHHVFTTVPAARYWQCEEINNTMNEKLSKSLGDKLQESHYKFVSRVTFESNERIKRVLDFILAIIAVTLFCWWYISDTLPSILDLLNMQRLLLYSGLTWLENHPIGFKLNERLTLRFGMIIRSCFWIHEYTCRTIYSIALGGSAARVFLSVTICAAGILHGGSSFLTLVFDVCIALTLPITSFAYIFQKLLSIELYLLSASWRLFRGKKRNILRQRTDTLEYESMQLLVGTIMFAMSLFLLTTIFVYYVFFMTLTIIYRGFLSISLLFPYRLLNFFPFGEILWRWKRRGWYIYDVVVIDRSPFINEWKMSATVLEPGHKKLSTTAIKLLLKELLLSIKSGILNNM
jgi:N-acetylglucosaminyl transferase component (Gpi1)